MNLIKNIFVLVFAVGMGVFILGGVFIDDFIRHVVGAPPL